MFKNSTICFLVIFALLTVNSLAFAKDISSNIVDESKLDSGFISINYNPQNAKLKAMISKGDEKYTYDLRKSNNRFPLQFGNGRYTVYILENVEGSRYKVLEKEEVNLQLKNENRVYLQSIQNINWKDSVQAVKKAKELTQNAKNDEERVVAIYNYIVDNIDYDHNKARNINTGYIPDIDDVIRKSKGICYDYAALFAGMLRSVGVPTKLIMGYKDDIKNYHAWNQVYLRDMDKWVTIDTTYDAGLENNGISASMFKNPKDYSIKKQY